MFSNDNNRCLHYFRQSGDSRRVNYGGAVEGALSLGLAGVPAESLCITNDSLLAEILFPLHISCAYALFRCNHMDTFGEVRNCEEQYEFYSSK